MYIIAMILLIILVVTSGFGLVMRNMVKAMDIVAIVITATLLISKDHDALGTHDIHAGIKKILTKPITIINEIKYLIKLLSFF